MLPDEGFAYAARAFALRLANGPTRAYAAAEAIVREQMAAGTAAADELTPTVSGALFATIDLKDGIASFLSHGPGHATFAGS